MKNLQASSMLIYRVIKRIEHDGNSSAIIAAPNEAVAELIHPDVKIPGEVFVDVLGVANSTVDQGVLLHSFCAES